jgi:hypothetical protein
MPVPNGRSRLKYRGGDFDLDENDDRSHNRDRRRRMHRDAQRAMVGIAFERMHVRHLDHGQQRQQDKTQHGDHRQSTWLCAAFPAEICCESCQQKHPLH